jgi:Protein of unknown function (DUF3592)
MAAVILTLLGVLALAGSGALFYQAWQARHGIVVEGTVVANKVSYTRADPGPDLGNQAWVRTPVAAPVVEYTDRSGQMHQVTSALSNARRPPVGSAMRVSYRPDQPDKAVVLMPNMAVARWLFLIVGLAGIAGAITEALHSHPHP